MTNSFRMRKYLARVLLPILTVWLCLAPSQAYAFVPAAIGGYGLPTAAEIAAASGGAGAASVVGAVDILAAGALIAVGASISYFAIDYFVGTEKNTVRIPLRDNTANAVPAPSAPSTALTLQQVTWFGNQTICTGPHGPFNSLREALDDYIGATCRGTQPLRVCPDNTTLEYQSYGVWSGCPGFNPFPGGAGNFSASTVLSCPNGYTASGQSCVLSNARQAAPDKACDLERSGSALAMISDSDCAASGDALPVICDGVNFWCGGRGVVNGQPVQYKIIPQTAGGSTVQVQQQQVVNGQTQVKTTNIEVNSSGTVEAVSGQVQAGTLSAPSGATATVNPLTPTIDSATNPQAPSGQAITFPSDYARTGEAASASTGIQTKLDTLHNDLTATTNTTDPTEPTVADMPGWGNTFTNLVSWQLPAHSGTCPTPSLDLSNVLGAGKVFVMNSHCTLINDHFNALQAAMTVVWSVLALFIVLRA